MSAPEVCALVLACVLGLCVTAVILAAIWFFHHFAKQLSITTELAARFPYRANPDDYGRLAVADQIASGRTGAESQALPEGRPGQIPAEPPREPVVPMSDGVWLPPQTE